MRTNLFTSLFLAASVTVSHATAMTAGGSQPYVQLGGTTLTGESLGSSMEFYGGIAYAEAPVGNLRFSRPKLKHSLSPLRSFDARNFGKACLQLEWPGQMSEDCLTLNVFKPSCIDVNSRLPVMVYFFGGGFSYGDSSMFNGTALVAQSGARGTPIIFVSLNYRIGPMGFPLGHEAVERGVLNLGLYDQRTALEWIQSNIASFGGDPKKVTVFGQSAGAMSASYHYLNPDFPKLARAAIFQSGVASSLPVFDAYRDVPSWDLFARNTRPCATASPNNTFACLMTASADDLLTGMEAGFALGPYPFRPVLDGPRGIMSDHPAKRLSRGAGGQVPFMAGTVLDEATAFIPLSFQTQDISLWMNANYTPSPLGKDALSAAVDKVVPLYSDDPSEGSPFDTGNQTFGTGSGFKRGAALSGDLLFQGTRRFWGRTATAPSYAYIFTDHQPDAYPALGVNHTSELPYLFGSYLYSGPPAHPGLSRAMLDYWISFAVSLTPNDGKGTSRPDWGLYGQTKEVLELNSNGIAMIPDNYRASSIDVIIGLNETWSW